MTQRIDSPVNCACFNIRKAARAVTQMYEEIMRKTGFRATQYSILQVVMQIGSVTIMRLAEALVTDRTTLTRNLAVLEKKEFIRITEGDDRRERKVEITERGKRALDKAYLLWREAQEKMAGRMGGDRFERLLSDLSKVVAAAKRG